MTRLIETLISGLSLGSIYALMALGYTMVYGIAKMLNFAHGDIIMVGAYAVVTSVLTLGMPPLVAILISIAVCALLAEHNVNILDISQTILQGSFTMVMAVDVGAAKVSVGELRDLLEQLGQKMEISIRIQREEIFDAMHRI